MQRLAFSTVFAALLLAAPVVWSSRLGIASAAQHASALPVTTAASRVEVMEGEASLTNRDVIRLHEAGVGQRVLIRLIGARRAQFRLGADEVLELKQAGLADDVIDAMLTTQRRNPVPLTF